MTIAAANNSITSKRIGDMPSFILRETSTCRAVGEPPTSYLTLEAAAQATSDLCTDRDLPDDFYFIDSDTGRWWGCDAVGPWTTVSNPEGKLPDWFVPIRPRSRLSPNLM
jgi:hypothetical protein